MSTVVVPEQQEAVLETDIEGSWRVLLRGLRESPELRKGLGFTVVLSLLVTAANLVIPVLVQQIIDHGFQGGFRPAFVYGLCAAATGLVAIVYFAGRAAARRLVVASENALLTLRTRAFAHIHELSIAEQTTEKRGVFVARVTADIDTLSHFTEWGGMAWLLSLALMIGSLALMLAYSWRLTIPVLVLTIPMCLLLLRLQKGILGAFDHLRTRVGELLSEVSESVMGAAVVRAYGLQEQMDNRVKRAIGRRYRAQMTAHLRSTALYPIANVVSALVVAGVVVVGATFGPEWGLTVGRVVAFLFLVNLFLDPLLDLPEIFTETQTAIAGWRKVLGVIDLPIDIKEADPGSRCPRARCRCAWRASSSRIERGDACSTASTSTSPQALTSRSWARRAAGSRRSRSCCPGSPIRPRAASCSAGSTCATWRGIRDGRRCAWSRRTGSSSTPASGRTFAPAGPAPATTTWSGRSSTSPCSTG